MHVCLVYKYLRTTISSVLKNESRPPVAITPAVVQRDITLVRQQSIHRNIFNVVLFIYVCSVNCIYLHPIQDILYVDDDIVVANKPSNLLCVPGRVEKDSLATRCILLSRYPQCGRRQLDWRGLPHCE